MIEVHSFFHSGSCASLHQHPAFFALSASTGMMAWRPAHLLATTTRLVAPGSLECTRGYATIDSRRDE
jgi:hypothetical protein